MPNLLKKIVAIATTLTCTVWLVGPGVAQALTADEIQAMIDDLLVQISELQEQLEETEGDTGGEVPASCVGVSFDRHLSQGDSGSDVKCLQALLNSDADTKLADSGVGSPGNETEYFGPLTKAGAVKFQEKYQASVLAPWGLTSGTGYVGDTTIAKLDELLSAGVGEQEEEEEEEEEEPVTGSPEVELASDTPEASQVALSAQKVIFTKLKFSGGSDGVTINKVVVARGGVSADTDLTAIELYDGTTQVGSTQALNTLTHKATFSSLSWEVPAGETKYLTIKGDVAASGTANTGDSIKLGVATAGDITASEDLEGSFPLYGKAMTIAGISVGGLVVDVRTTPATSTLLSGATDQEVASWTFTASSTEGMDVHEIVVTHVGSATDEDVKNIKLKVAGQQVGETVEELDSQNKAVFDLSSDPLSITAGTSKIVYAYADVSPGIWTSRTITFEITQYTDVTAYGNNSGGATTITTDVNKTYSKQTGNTMTVGQGTLAISVDGSVNPAAQTYVKGTSDRLFSAFKFTAGSEEGVRVVKLRLKISGTGSNTDVSNVTLWDGSTQIAGPASVIGSYVTFGSNTVGYDATGLFDVGKSSSKTILVKADVPHGATAGNTIDLDVAASSDVWADGLDSNYDVPSSAVTGTGNANKHTVGAKGSLTVAKSANTPASQTYVVGSTDKEFTRIDLTAGSGEDVIVSSIQLDLFSNHKNATSGAHLNNVKLVRVDNGEQYGSTVSSPTNSATFSESLTVPASGTVTLKAVADVPITNYPNPTATIALASTTAVTTALTSDGASSAAAITETGSAVGNTITISSGSLTVAKSASPGDQTLITGANEVPISGLVMTAGTAEDVRVTSLKLTMTSTGEASSTDVSNIALYSGGSRLTTEKNLDTSTAGSVYPNTLNNTVSWTASDFLNSAGLDIAKGQQKVVYVKVDLPGTANNGHKFTLGVSTTDHMSLTGISSNSDLTPTFSNASSGVNYHYEPKTKAKSTAVNEVTISTGGDVTTSVNADTPVTAIHAVGTEGNLVQDVVFTKVNFKASLEDVYVKSVTVERSGGSDDDFGAISLWDGATQLGSDQILSNGSTTFNFNTEEYWQLTKSVEKVLTIKGDLNGVATQYGSGASTGDAPLLRLDTFDAQGVSSGNDSLTSEGRVDLGGETQYLRQSKPTIATASLPTSNLTVGEKTLYRWTVSASEEGSIGWKMIAFNITGTLGGLPIAASSGDPMQTIDGIYTDQAGSLPNLKMINDFKVWNLTSNAQVTGTSTDMNGVAASSTGFFVRCDTDASAGYYLVFVPASEQQVAAGTTKSYELRGTVLSNDSLTTGDAILTKIDDLATSATTSGPWFYAGTLNTGGFTANSSNLVSRADSTASTTVSFVWTDRSGAGATHSAITSDWTNDYKVDGLPATTLTLSY